MSTSAITIHENDGILNITINRPERKNAFTPEMYSAFAEAIEAAGTSDSVRVALVRGAGGNFSTGNDVKDFLDSPPTGDQDPVFRFLRAIAHFPKPWIAVVEGFAVGVGMTMLLHADLVYAAPSAKFQLPFVNLGLVPEAGSSYLLPLLVGHLKASEFCLLGESIDAESALRCGVVNQLIDDKEIYEFAMGKARLIASRPPFAVQQTKGLLKQAHASNLAQQMAAEDTIFLKQLRTPEAIAALRAFFERKK